MILHLGVLVLFGSVWQSYALPPCVCARHLRPVCGSDQRTYNNECLLRCAQATDPQLLLASSGRCDGGGLGPPRDVREAESICFCTFEYMPFCGTDGRTYSNRCALNCAKRSGPVEVAHPGPCRDKRETENSQPSCTCPRHFAPVCGSDGKTYGNGCLLDCVGREAPELRVRHPGPCETETQACTCSREASPVCGTDGNTYENPCYLTCAKETTATDLEIAHDGECDESVKVADIASCTCTREEAPVCGTDGKTYGNPCMLNCARNTDQNLDVDHEGPCDTAVELDDKCDNLPRRWRPVCGSDGKTYRNPSTLYCARNDDDNLKIEHAGPCVKVPVLDFNCTGCTRRRKPVCGTDGNTYMNPCLLNCARERNDSLHIDYEGVCDERVKVELPPCTCTREGRPMCGSDGKTYGNPCLLDCARAADGSLNLQYEGPCDHRLLIVENAEDAPCACARNLQPVCASNGVTYSNRCLMKCAGADLTVAKEGSCDE